MELLFTLLLIHSFEDGVSALQALLAFHHNLKTNKVKHMNVYILEVLFVRKIHKESIQIIRFVVINCIFEKDEKPVFRLFLTRMKISFDNKDGNLPKSST